MEVTKEHAIIGRRARIVFPEMEAAVTYTSDVGLHWETVDDKGDAVLQRGAQRARIEDNAR